MGFKEAINTCLKQKYGSINGRATRSEYWYFVLFVTICGMAPLLIGGFFFALTASGLAEAFSYIGVAFFVIGGLFYLGMFIPMICVCIRRYHDCNLSGWWVLAVSILGIVPYIGVLVSLASFVITVIKGTEGANRFGPDQLRPEGQAEVFA